MIESIEIKNFRCFKDTKIAKFGLVNLFGGLNNAGKTALLEAICLTESPHAHNVMFLHRVIRKEEMAFIKEKPKNAWDNLFYAQNKEQEILICTTNNSDTSKTFLNCDEEVDELIKFTNDENDDDFIQMHSMLSNRDSIKSALHLKILKNEIEQYSSILVANKDGIVVKNSSGITINNADFIPASLNLSTSSLAEEYEKARYEEKNDILLEAFQLIDKTIEKIETFTIGKPLIYLKRKNEGKMPLGLFGDAMNKIANIILTIVNNPKATILIDEVENGIHYTNQEKLWKMLFKLAIEFDVQIFSTSHSLEMIKAFAKVAKQFPKEAAYFEMARSQKTGLIKGIRHDVNTLAFELDRNMTIRGE